jgi:hypothetical protein
VEDAALGGGGGELDDRANADGRRTTSSHGTVTAKMSPRRSQYEGQGTP